MQCLITTLIYLLEEVIASRGNFCIGFLCYGLLRFGHGDVCETCLYDNNDLRERCKAQEKVHSGSP